MYRGWTRLKVKFGGNNLNLIELHDKFTIEPNVVYTNITA